MMADNFTKFLKENNIPHSPGVDIVKMLTPDSLAAEWNQ
jgi:hypothetical protein